MDFKSLLNKMVPMLLALIIYDAFIKGFAMGLFNKYDDTLNRLNDEPSNEIRARLSQYNRIRKVAA